MSSKEDKFTFTMSRTVTLDVLKSGQPVSILVDVAGRTVTLDVLK